MNITAETKMAATGLNIFLPIALKGKTDKVAAVLTSLERDHGYHVHAVTPEDLKGDTEEWAAQAKENAGDKPVILFYDGYADEGMPGAVRQEAVLMHAKAYDFHPVIAVGPYGMDSAMGNRFLHISF